MLFDLTDRHQASNIDFGLQYIAFIFFFFKGSAAHRVLPSSPTRPFSDLAPGQDPRIPAIDDYAPRLEGGCMRVPPRILIADDQPMNVDILQMRLAVHGYELLTAADGEIGRAHV